MTGEPLTREQVLEHALRALIHAQPDGDAIMGARLACVSRPGHSVLSRRAVEEIDRLNDDANEDLDFSAALPPVKPYPAGHQLDPRRQNHPLGQSDA